MDLAANSPKTWRALSLITFLCSLAIPAFTGNEPEPVYGLAALLLGWLGPLDGHVSWLANPTLILSWKNLLKDSQKARALSVLSLFLACSFFFTKNINTNGTYPGPIDIHLGYAIWLLSIIFQLVAASLALTGHNPNNSLKADGLQSPP